MSHKKAKSTKKATKKSTTKSKPASKAKATQARPSIPASADCPYRPGTLYGTLFTEGSKDYIPKADLIKRVAELTGKSETVVEYAFQVLKAKNHRSNKGRSTLLVEGDKVKLIALK